MNHCKDAVHLLLDLLLAAFQLRRLRACSTDVLGNVFDVVILVQDVDDIWKVSLEKTKGVAVSVFDHCNNINTLCFQPL